MIEKLIARLDLVAVKDRWRAVEPKLNEYKSLYGEDRWLKKYINKNSHIWEFQMRGYK